MPRKKKRKTSVPKEKREASAPASPSTAARGSRWWTRRTAIELLLLALGIVAVVIVYSRERAGPPNTIADGAESVRPEVAEILREASQAVDRLIEDFPDTPDALDAVAWAHQKFGRTKEAVFYWERCLELDPRAVRALHSLGTLAQDSGELDRAVECFQKAAELDPQASRYRLALAETLMNQARLEESFRVLEEELQKRPNSIPALILIGQVCEQLKRDVLAVKYLETAVEMAPDFASAHFALGNACARLGEKEKAKVYLERFKVLKAKDEQAHRDLLKTTDDVRTARQNLAEIYLTAAKVYVAYSKVQTAEDCLRRAVELNPELAESRRVLAWLYRRQGRDEEALAELNALEENAAGDPAVWRSLGDLYGEVGRFEKAEHAYQKLIGISPRQGAGHAALAGLYLQTDRKIPEARALAQKAVDLEPSAPYYLMLATACRRGGDLAGALAAIEEALAREPGNPEYGQMRDAIKRQLSEGEARLPSGDGV